ncbi:MAG TPA: DsbA family oxidoreductase [Nevskiaceae bacterium]
MNANTATKLRIDFVSDVVCPWCAIGLTSLEQALQRLHGVVDADLHFQPFELDPHTPAAGEDASEHLKHKYSIDDEQLAANRATIRQRAAALGFAYNIGPGSRVYNTLDAHRLLHWAELEGGDALALKKALLKAYFTDGEDVSDHAVLARIAASAGFDEAAARALLDGTDYTNEVRDQERRYQTAGIHSVPATIVNGTQLISGGQPPEVFERALRDIASHGAA